MRAEWQSAIKDSEGWKLEPGSSPSGSLSSPSKALGSYIEAAAAIMTGSRHTLGFVGLGNMGSQMAHNLAVFSESKGYPQVQIWNRTREKIEHMRETSFVHIAESLELLAEACDIIHLCLGSDEAAFAIVRQILKTGKRDLIIADHSTLFPTTSATLQDECRQQGVSFCSCPVFGPPAGAKSAALLISLSGPEAARVVLKEYMVPTIGKAYIECGEDASKGALLKILGNNCILGTIELLSESFVLAEKTGFDADLFYEFIRKSPSRIFRID